MGRLLQGLLLVRLRWHNTRMRLTLVAAIHAVGIVAHLLRAGVTPVPVLAPGQGNVSRGCSGGLAGAFDSPVQLILSLALEVVLRLRLRHPRRGLLLVHPMPRGRAHAWTVLRVVVVIAHVALVAAAHVWVRSRRRRVGTRHARPKYSSDAIHIHFAVHICSIQGQNLYLQKAKVGYSIRLWLWKTEW